MRRQIRVRFFRFCESDARGIPRRSIVVGTTATRGREPALLAATARARARRARSLLFARAERARREGRSTGTHVGS